MASFWVRTMFAASSAAEIFRCPGEDYNISRSVHLARLAAFYSKCRNCPHAPADDGRASAPDPDHDTRKAPSRPASVFVSEGVRGRYLCELTRATAAEIAGAMASRLWDDFACSAHERNLRSGVSVAPDAADEPSTEGIRILKPERPGPLIVIAHDERPSSPDIATGVGQALRRMGCQVVDIGLTTRPCFMFAIAHLTARGGIMVTGAGCDPGWTGLDFVDHDGIPCSVGGGLDGIDERLRSGYSRPSRRPGSHSTFQASVPYEAGLWKHFHALRPLKIGLACSSHAVRDVFDRLFRKLACRLIPVDAATRRRDLNNPTDPDLARVARTIREAQADLGIVVEDDGEQCTFLDEQGRLVLPRLIADLLAENARLDQRAEVVAVYPALWRRGQDAAVESRSTSEVARRQRSEVYVSDPTRENVTREMHLRRALIGADGLGRFWFAESTPSCDALLTVVHLLQALSRSDAPLSRVVADVGA
jgi:phosphomannomutase